MELYNLILRGNLTLWLTPSGLHFYHSSPIQMPKYIQCFQCISAAASARSKIDSESSYVQHWQVSFSSVQFSSVTQLCPTLRYPMDHSIPGLSVHHQLPEFTQTHVHWVGDAIQPSHPLSSHSPPALNLSQCQGFSNESVLCIRWPKYLNLSFSISPSNEYSGMISFRMAWFDLAVQGALKCLFQYHSSKASILWCSAFFMVQFSHTYMTTGKTTALTRWTFAGKVMSLLFYLFYLF